MATVTRVLEKLSNERGPVHLVTWTPLTTTNNDGQAVEISASGGRCVQVFGTFGAGGTLVIQGSNDNSNWATLSDPNGNALSFTAARIDTIVGEITRYIRPNVTGGDGTTSLSCLLLLRRETR